MYPVPSDHVIMDYITEPSHIPVYATDSPQPTQHSHHAVPMPHLEENVLEHKSLMRQVLDKMPSTHISRQRWDRLHHAFVGPVQKHLGKKQSSKVWRIGPVLVE